MTVGTARFTAHRRTTVSVTIRLSQRARSYLGRHAYLEAGLAIVVHGGRASRSTAATVVI